MSLQINISDSRAEYRPGDQVSGTVTFVAGASKNLSAQQVYVSLKHTSKCRFGLPELETLYSADLTLHEQTIELLEAPATLSTDNKWPFKFVIPESTGFFASPFHEPSRLYNDEPDQVLPPTFKLANKDTATQQGSVKINLGIYAEVATDKVRSNVLKKDAISAVSFLNFQPARKQIHVNWDMTTKQNNFEVRTPLLAETNGHRQRSLSIKEKMLTSIKSSSLPTASFDVLMSLPKTVVTGQPVPLFIGLQHDRASNSAQDNPPVTLKSLIVNLTTVTALRGLSESKSLFRADYLPASHSSSSKVTELAKLGTPVELNDIVDLREHLVVRIPSDTIQSFRTYNITRSYGLTVLVNVECAKQKFSKTFDISPLIVVAAHDNDKISPPGVAPGLDGMNGERLPTWEESGGYGMHGIPEETKEEALPPQYA